MKELIVHADKVTFEVTKKTRLAEEIPSEMQKGEMENVMWVRIAVEKGDEKDINSIAERAVLDIEQISDKVKSRNVLLYPYAHLLMGAKPASKEAAIDLLKGMAGALRNAGFTVVRAPFGWYKKFTVHAKGHPLSELSRVFTVEEKVGEEKVGVSTSLEAEEKLKSKFYVLTPEGELVEHQKFDYSEYPNLEKFVKYETEKVRAYEKEPPHIAIMKEQQLVDYEPGTDPGNFRWYPKGRLVKKLLERWITEYCVDYGAMEVETPLMYDYEHPSLKKYLNRFPARQYVVLSDEKRYFLRFAACFGQFLIAHDAVISHKDLPMKMYELTRYSFRREQSGELAGLKRLRGFTMPDMHAFVSDNEMAKTEFEQQLDLGVEWLGSVGLYGWTEVGFRIQSDFYKEHREWYVGMVKRLGKPVLVEMFDERYAYFITKFEFNFVDSAEKASALTTVQIDVENADTYNISYVDEKGEKKRPLLTHASISGSIERVVYALLEKEAMRMGKGEKAMLPLWLSPTQVRVIPIGENHVKFAEKLLGKFEGVRADIDDRSETLGKKVRDAEKEWIPYIIVVGDKEVESGKLSVTVRAEGKKREMEPSEIVKEIKKAGKGMPFEKLSLPQRLSKRPIFHG